MGFLKYETSLKDVWIIKPQVFGDSRGFFMEVYNHQAFDEIGLGDLTFVQDNLSASAKGTIRGLHFQRPPFAQGKLVTNFRGRVLDVVVDIRQGSPTYGQYLTLELDAENPTFLYIPEGMAHGFQVLSETCLFFYKCTQVYHQPSEGGIAWNDPGIAIPWKDIPPIISQKDHQNPPLVGLASPF